MIETSTVVIQQVRMQWAEYARMRWRRINSGLINKTYCIIDSTGTPQAIVQQLHPVFTAEVNINIEAITAHLRRKGITTTRLIRTDQGALWAEVDGQIWRALEYVPGQSYEQVSDQKMVFEAGKLVGKFHRALSDFEHRYPPQSRNIHNTLGHLQGLRIALDTHRRHRLFSDVSVLSDSLLGAAESLPELDDIFPRHAHGDLKISNVLFNEKKLGICLIDLDTLCRMIWPFEMGDALRSWCNPQREEQRPAHFSLDLFDSAVRGYAASQMIITSEERAALLPGLIQICLELCVRFLADALNETYFGWDKKHFENRGAHNLARARAMWELYCSVLKQRAEAEHIVTSHFR